MTGPSPPGAARSTILPCHPRNSAYSVQRPAGAVQFERAVAVHARREIDRIPGIAVRHQDVERQIARVSHLVERQRLQVGVGCDRFDEVRDLNGTSAPRRARRGHRADRPEERSLTQPHRLGEPLAGGERPGLVRDRPRARLVADPGSAERPAGPGGHVDAEAQAIRLAQRVLEHAEPLVGQERDELRFRRRGRRRSA